MAHNVSGIWHAVQSNGAVVRFQTTQAGEKLTGDASTSGMGGGVEGSVVGEDLFLIVSWHPGDSVGQYSGTFNPNGSLTGTTVDLTHPNSQATWFSNNVPQG